MLQLLFVQEVGEESKLARSIERVRDLIRKKRQERKDRKERKYAEKFQQIVLEAQQAHATSVAAREIDKPGLLAETKFHRLSYQVSKGLKLQDILPYITQLTLSGIYEPTSFWL